MASGVGMMRVLRTLADKDAPTVNAVDLLDANERGLVERAVWRGGWAWTLTPEGRNVLETGKFRGQR